MQVIEKGAEYNFRPCISKRWLPNSGVLGGNNHDRQNAVLGIRDHICNRDAADRSTGDDPVFDLRRTRSKLAGSQPRSARESRRLAPMASHKRVQAPGHTQALAD